MQQESHTNNKFGTVNIQDKVHCNAWKYHFNLYDNSGKSVSTHVSSSITDRFSTAYSPGNLQQSDCKQQPQVSVKKGSPVLSTFTLHTSDSVTSSGKYHYKGNNICY